MKLFKIVVIAILISGQTPVQSQITNNTCANASPYCTGQTMTFPAATGVTGSQPGPFYGCLLSQPNPAWFFMQIASGGPMAISMSANNDIDFICWGPFSSLATACNSLTSANVQSCSYSPSNTETCTIANAIPGMFYMLLITNFSNSVQNITFSQTGGSATTNCGFVCLITPTNSGMACAGTPVTISLTSSTSSAVTSYTWFGPGSFSSTVATNVLLGLQTGGNYTVRATASSTIGLIPYTSTCQAITAVSVVPYPTFSVTPSATSICQGGSFSASVTFTPASNPSQYFFNWSPASGAGVWSPQAPSTFIQPNLLPVSVTLATVIYSVTVQPSFTAVSCATTKSVVVMINNPITPSLSMPPPMCNINNGVLLIASPGGGTWSANPALSPGGMFTPNLAAIGTNTVTYAVSVGTCVVSNTATLQVSKFHTAALSSGISQRCEQDPPFGLMNIVQDSTTGIWSGQNVIGNFFNPSGLSTGIYNLTYSTVSVPNPTTCPAFTVLAVSVFHPPTPTITPIAPTCNNSPTVMLTAIPGGGVWIGGLGVSPTGIQNPAQNLVGSNTLSYTMGQGTCVATSSRTFHVSQFNTAALTGTVPHLCASSSPFGLMNIVQSGGGSWSGQGVGTSNVFNPAGLPSNLYILTYLNPSSPDPLLCPDSETIVASVLNPAAPNITLIPPKCSNDAAFQMTVNPATGNWVSMPYLNSLGLFTPSLSLIGNNSVQYIIGTNTCNAQQIIFVSTEAFVPATILKSVNSLCNTNAPVSLLPLTANNLGVWSGPGVVGSAFDPGISNAGSFQLIYSTASSPGGLCPDADTLAVNVYSLAIPVIKQVGPICNTSPPLQLQVSPLGGIFSGATGGAINPEGIFQPALAIFGNNLVSYSIASGPCVAFAQSTIAVEAFISADFEKLPEQAYCRNQISFDLTALVKNPGGFWNGPGVIGSLFDPALANSGNNNIIVYRTHSIPTASLCPDTSAIRIKVKDMPVITAIASQQNGCAPLIVTFRSPGFNVGKTAWYFDDGTAEQAGFLISHVFTKPGTYQVVYNYWDEEAATCSAQVVFPEPILVYPVPEADFLIEPSEITIAAPDLVLTNLTKILGDNKYVWTIPGLQQYYELHPKISLPQIGTYKITLSATNIFGCVNELTKYVEVKNDFLVYIPNSFSPNFDGINDYFLPVFSPYGLDPATYQMDIFDRWGQVIFSTKDHSEGWDGTFQNAGQQNLKQDSYIYKVKFRDLEGKIYQKIGSVILL